MDLFDNNEVDLITLEAGQGYFAGRYHSMRPILAEDYVGGSLLDSKFILNSFSSFPESSVPRYSS